MPTPIWLSEAEPKKYSPLNKDLKADVVVNGGGITGATTAYLLKKAGLKVVVLEKGTCANGESGHTSAHLAYVTDMRLHKLANKFGNDVAHAVWDAGLVAIRQIEDLVRSLKIECGFSWVPGYLHSPWDEEDADSSERQTLERDAQLADEFGFAAQMLDVVPVAGRPGVRYSDQAIFQPVRYVDGLLKHVPGGGAHVFDESEVDEVDADGTVHCRGHKITCDHVIMATHRPLKGKMPTTQAALFDTHLAAYSTYVLSARLAKGTASSGVFWDTADPYNYLRLEDREDHVLAVFGGEDHKTGQMKNTTEPFQRLEQRWSKVFPGTRVGKHWSGQVIESNDGLPFIGEMVPRQYVATGFAGNGLTFGTLSGMMIRDQIIGVVNPWRELFKPDRTALRGGIWQYLKENVDYPRYFLQDRMVPAQGNSVRDVPIGCGKILKLNGEKVAVYRDTADHVSCHSAICPHMGCVVHWNSAERTWDCPCHGSRFTATGEVIAGPAESPLEEHSATHAPGK